MIKKTLIFLLLICFLFSVSQALVSEYIVINFHAKGGSSRMVVCYVDMGFGFKKWPKGDSLVQILNTLSKTGYEIITISNKWGNGDYLIILKHKKVVGEK